MGILRIYFYIAIVITIASCGSSDSHDDKRSSVGIYDRDASKFMPFDEFSIYQDVLSNCIAAQDVNSSCSFNELPLLAMQHQNTISVTNILQRTVVSHQWMGERFEQVLSALPSELLSLFASVAAIAISDDIRHSYFHPRTATIYLDPAYLWLTNAEKVTIQKTDDSRSDPDKDLSFDLHSRHLDDLDFVMLSRYVKEGKYAWNYYNLDGDEERGLSQIIHRTARLLLHELAHANDYFPSQYINSFERHEKPDNVSQVYKHEWTSTQLENNFPLSSSILFDLAKVTFGGEKANSNQMLLTALDVGQIFEADIANDDYNYQNYREDVAMLFEEAMMSILFGIQRDISFTNQSQDRVCDQFVVSWGERGRIGHANIKPRLELVLGSISNLPNISELVDAIPSPIALPIGVNWCEVLNVQ